MTPRSSINLKISWPDSLLDASNAMDETHNIPLVVIVGPTAVGKTEMAIELAERFNGEIISADSRQFYRGMDIGTAKPSPAQRKRVPHHLIDVADPNETWSLAEFQRAANRAIREIYERHALPFLVGGTGQFVRSIIEGWLVPPARPDPKLRKYLDQWADEVGAIELHKKLATIDRQAASFIDPSNIRRTVRALEVIFATGKRFSDQRSRGYKLYDSILLGLTRPRAELYQRIDARIDQMIESGFIDEVKRLLDAGYAPDLPTMSAIGYGEIVAYLQGKILLAEAIKLMKRRTRIFVRRQANWFKENDPNINWFQVDEDSIEEIANVIEVWIYSIKGVKTIKSN